MNALEGESESQLNHWREKTVSIRNLFVNENPGASSPEDLPLVQLLRHGREVVVSPSLATRILNECRYQHQRSLREWRIAYHVGEMKHDRFRQGRQISLALVDGRLILINGYHRLTAVVRSGRPAAFMIEVVPVNTEGDVMGVYATYDVGGGERSILETAGGMLDQTELSKPQMSALLRAVQIISTGFHRPNVNEHATILYSRIARNNAANAWHGVAERYFTLVSGATRQVKVALYRQPVVAAALMTLQYQPEKAETFWQGLAMDDDWRGTTRARYCMRNCGARRDRIRSPPSSMRWQRRGTRFTRAAG